jgi:hypothetical protein
MGSQKGRTMADWSGSPEGWIIRGVIQIYYNKGHRLDSIGECLRKHIPRDVYLAVIGVPDVTDNAILQRGHKGVLPKNAFEHPDKHPVGKMMLPIAQRIVAENRKVTLEELKALASAAVGTKQEIATEDLLMDDQHKAVGGVFYILSNGSKNCAIGITHNKEFTKRTDSFKKGDLDGVMTVRYAFWLADPRRVETEIKRKFADFARGSERFAVQANHMADMVEHYANLMQIPRYSIILREEELV